MTPVRRLTACLPAVSTAQGTIEGCASSPFLPGFFSSPQRFCDSNFSTFHSWIASRRRLVSSDLPSGENTRYVDGLGISPTDTSMHSDNRNK